MKNVHAIGHLFCKTNRRTALRHEFLIRGLVAAALLPISSVAFAQQDTALPEDEASTNKEIIVSASRITNDSGFVAPTPITVQTAADFKAFAATNVADVLYELPQIQREQPGGTRSANPGGNFVNLRGLGNARTLVLIDRRRVVATSIQGNVDLNTIPSSLIERMELVTGGASAAWGSDAVAGVVNLILKKNFEGVTATGQYNVTNVGDGEQRSYQVAAGKNFVDGRLNIMAAADIVRRDGISTLANRDWGRPQYASMRSTAPNSPTVNVISDNATFSTMTAGGVIITPSVSGSVTLANGTRTPGLQFGPGGTLIPFNYGTNVDSLFQIGGGGGWLGDNVNIVNPVERDAFFGRMTFEANEHLNITAEASYSSSHSAYDVIIPYDPSLTISASNPFIPADLKARLTAAKVTSFTMGRLQYEYGPDITDGKNVTKRFMIGADGEIVGGWRYNVYYQHGVNKYKFDVYSRNKQKFLDQIDAVLNSNGQIVCRTTLTNPTNGCVPVNLFGPGSVSTAAVAYANGVGTFNSTYTQDVAAFDVQGTIVNLPAGPLDVAMGLEWRREELVGTSDALSQAQAWRLGNSQAVSGSESVKEVFGEANIPIFNDAPWAKSLDLNAAVRFTDYRLAGPATTWKVGLSYEPNDWLRFRGTLSRDIRAPRVNELFSPSVSGSGSFFDPLLRRNYRVPNTATVGNIDLKPEKAKTLTVGTVFRPQFLPGFQASVDYYDIKISDAIGNYTSQQVLDRCYPTSGGAPDALACSMIVRSGPLNEISALLRRLSNLNNVRNQGLDFEASYRFPLLTGNMSMRLLANKPLEVSTLSSGVLIDTQGELGRSLNGQFTASYSDDRLTVSTNVRYIGPGKVDNTWLPNDGRVNHVGAYAYVGASVQYDLVAREKHTVKAFFRVNNLFDKDPPILYDDSQQPTRTDANVYDAIGRNFAMGITVEF